MHNEFKLEGCIKNIADLIERFSGEMCVTVKFKYHL